MNLNDFFEKVETDDEIEGVDVVEGETPEDDYIVVKERGVYTKMSVLDILRQDWDTLRKTIIGQYTPPLLYHMSRIVGYLSKIENWHESAIGELKDRRAGNYEID